jgi:hypothetical protein
MTHADLVFVIPGILVPSMSSESGAEYGCRPGTGGMDLSAMSSCSETYEMLPEAKRPGPLGAPPERVGVQIWQFWLQGRLRRETGPLLPGCELGLFLETGVGVRRAASMFVRRAATSGRVVVTRSGSQCR